MAQSLHLGPWQAGQVRAPCQGVSLVLAGRVDIPQRVVHGVRVPGEALRHREVAEDRVLGEEAAEVGVVEAAVETLRPILF